jgi:hypothetical protein
MKLVRPFYEVGFDFVCFFFQKKDKNIFYSDVNGAVYVLFFIEYSNQHAYENKIVYYLLFSSFPSYLHYQTKTHFFILFSGKRRKLFPHFPLLSSSLSSSFPFLVMSFLSLEQCKAAVSALDNEPFRYLAEFVSIPFPLTAISYKAHTNYLLNRSAIANLDVREIQGGAMTYASGSIQMVEFLAENDIQFITRFGLVVPDEINAYREIEQVDEEGKLEYVVKEFSEQPTSVVVVRGLVYPERDLKREPYLTILIYFNSGANLFAAYCECKAGGKFKSICKHCSAVCCLLEQLKVHGNSSLLEYNTCTMEPCGWIAPRDRFASGVPIHDIVFKKRNKKILPENSDRKYRSDRGQDRARSPTPEVRILTPEDVKAFSEEIAEEPCYKDRKPAIAILARCPAVQPMRRPIPPPATRLEQPISRSRPLLPCDNINYTLGPSMIN